MISYHIRSFAAGSTLAAAALLPLHAQQRAIGPRESSSSSAARAPTSRRVWSDPAEDQRDGGNVSPDGRSYAFAAGREAALAVRTLATGETRYLTGSRASQPTSDASAYTPMFSPDGKHIAYAWDVDSLPGYEVQVIDVDGGSRRRLYRPVGSADPIPTDWSRDGRYVVATEATSDRTVRLLLLPIDGGAPRVLKSFLDWQRPSHAKMSPDGKLLAYDNRPSKDAIGRDVYVLSLDGSRESAVITGPADDQLVGWTSDGRLVFVSDKQGSPVVWATRLGKDNTAGELTLVKKDLWRSADFDLTANGTLFYSVQSGDRDVFSAAFNPATFKLTSKPVGITGHPGEAHSVADISSDGRRVVYFTGSTDLRREKYSRFGTTTITVRPLDGGPSQTLTPKLAGISEVVWAPDNKSLILRARDDKGRPAMQRLDLKTGEVTLTNYPIGPPSFSKDGKWMYAFASTGKTRDRTARLFVLRPADSTERTIWQTQEPGWGPASSVRGSLRTPLLSPDGRSLVFTNGHVTDSAYVQRVLVIDATNGAMRELVSATAFPNDLKRPATFTPDGKSLLLLTSEMTGNPLRRPSRLWRVPMAGGDPQPIEMPRTDFELPILSPDGRRLVFTAGTVSPEYWVLEDSRLGFGSQTSHAAGADRR
jgi:Tol biopolymer transport system component